MEDLAKLISAEKRRHGLIDLEQMISRFCVQNTVLDAFSLCISAKIILGGGNLFYPNVTIIASKDADIHIGTNNTFLPGTLIHASAGSITIGSGNQFGEGGFSCICNRAGSEVRIGDNGRYLHGVAVYGRTILGDGSQVIGSIIVDSCFLEAGEAHTANDPTIRGAVLKGTGVAKNLTVGKGQVISGFGQFTGEMAQGQINFHRN